MSSVGQRGCDFDGPEAVPLAEAVEQAKIELRAIADILGLTRDEGQSAKQPEYANLSRGGYGMRNFRFWRLAQTPKSSLYAGYRFGLMNIGAYAHTTEGGELCIGCGLGPLFIEISWYPSEMSRLAKLMWDL